MWDHLRGNTLTDIGRMKQKSEERRQEEAEDDAGNEREPRGQATLDQVIDR